MLHVHQESFVPVRGNDSPAEGKRCCTHKEEADTSNGNFILFAAAASEAPSKLWDLHSAGQQVSPVVSVQDFKNSVDC